MPQAPRCKDCGRPIKETNYPGFGIRIVRCTNPVCQHSWPAWAKD